MNNNKSINGLVDIQADTIESNYYNGVPSSKIIYLSNVTSDIQQQIDNLNTSISGQYINNTYLQNQINSLSGTIYNNYIISNDYFNTISSYINSNNNINNIQNSFLLSLSSSFNNNLIYNTNYFNTISSYIVSNNNINTYQNLYLNSISSYINTYNSNNNNINTYQNLYLNSISSYINNNTIYQNNVNNYYDLYLYSLSGYIQNIQLIPGPRGLPGINGTNGTNGSNGSNGEKGDKGDKGDTGDTGPPGTNADAGLILGVVNAAVTAAVTAGGVASLSALAGQVQSIQTEVIANSANITILNEKTQFQSVLGTTTNFSGDVTVSNPILNVRLSSDGTTTSKFYSGIECDAGSVMNGLQVTNNLQSDTIQANSISVDNNKFKMFKSGSNVNQISYNSISTSIRDAGIEFTNNFNPFLLSDTGTINMRAGNINIGNADQTSIVYINGTVYFNNPINFSNFFNQFA